MSPRFTDRKFVISAAVAVTVAISASFSFASETSLAATISAAFPAVEPEAGSGNLVAETPNEAIAAPVIALTPPAPAEEKSTAAQSTAVAANDAELECMAKVVHHEAANQPREGQLAVAQLIMNRVESGRFADTVCGVANQPGQFFKTASYNPRRDDKRWKTALDVSREAMAGVTADVVPGALFYHAAYQAPPRFFRSRPRAGVLGDHIFYR